MLSVLLSLRHKRILLTKNRRCCVVVPLYRLQVAIVLSGNLVQKSTFYEDHFQDRSQNINAMTMTR